jgi:hypothetical protein
MTGSVHHSSSQFELHSYDTEQEVMNAGSGTIIGSTVGHAAVGALIGGPVGADCRCIDRHQLMG